MIKEYFVKLAVWLVVVVGINVAMDFFVHALVFLGYVFIFSLGERWMEHLPEPEKQYTFAIIGDLIFLNSFFIFIFYLLFFLFHCYISYYNDPSTI